MKDISENTGGKQKMCVELWFDFAAPGLNGSKGLIRSHWRAYQKLKEKFNWLIIEQGFERIPGKVKVTYKRTSQKPMDWTNLASSFKAVEDVMVKIGIIKDDSPETIPFPPTYQQEKGKPSMYIKIEEL